MSYRRQSAAGNANRRAESGKDYGAPGMPAIVLFMLFARARGLWFLPQMDGGLAAEGLDGLQTLVAG